MGDDAVSSSTASERGSPLTELNKSSAKISTWLVKIVYASIEEWTFTQGSRQVTTYKLKTILNSLDEGHYAVGVMRAAKGDKQELEKALKDKWVKGAVYRLSKVGFHNEQPQYIHTPFKLVLDLRRTKETRIIGPTLAPAEKAVPPSTVASILNIKLRKNASHQFDVMGLCAINGIRHNDTKLGPRAIVDISVFDGSKAPSGKTATLDFTLFFPVSVKDAKSDECDKLSAAVGASEPISFFALSVYDAGESKIGVRPSREFHWEIALPASSKAAGLSADKQLQKLDQSDKEQLTAKDSWEPTRTRAFLSESSIHTAVALLDTFTGVNAEMSCEKVYQLNYVEIEPPAVGESVCTDAGDRIWLKQLQCRDTTGSISLAMRQKAALQLAGLDASDASAVDKFRSLAALGQVQFPLLSSIRVTVEKRPNRSFSKESVGEYRSSSKESVAESQSTDATSVFGTSSYTNMVIVEASEQDLTHSPNASSKTLLSFLAECASRDDAIIAAPLAHIEAADHYPLLVRYGGVAQPCAKVLALVFATERTLQANLGDDAFRLTTANVLDALKRDAALKYQLSTLCHRDKLTDVILNPPRSGTRQQAALVTITGVRGQSEFQVEAVQLVAAGELASVTATMKRLVRLAGKAKFRGDEKRPLWNVSGRNPVTSVKKCRRMSANPTDSSLSEESD